MTTEFIEIALPRARVILSLGNLSAVKRCRDKRGPSPHRGALPQPGRLHLVASVPAPRPRSDYQGLSAGRSNTMAQSPALRASYGGSKSKPRLGCTICIQ